MTRALEFKGEDAGKEQRAPTGAMDGGQRICTVYAKKHRTDGGCSFMDTHGFFNYVHTDKLERTGKEGSRKKKGAEVRVSRKRHSYFSPFPFPILSYMACVSFS